MRLFRNMRKAQPDGCGSRAKIKNILALCFMLQPSWLLVFPSAVQVFFARLDERLRILRLRRIQRHVDNSVFQVMVLEAECVPFWHRHLLQ